MNSNTLEALPLRGRHSIAQCAAAKKKRTDGVIDHLRPLDHAAEDDVVTVEPGVASQNSASVGHFCQIVALRIGRFADDPARRKRFFEFFYAGRGDFRVFQVELDEICQAF
jgi:hypothetical protein